MQQESAEQESSTSANATGRVAEDVLKIGTTVIEDTFAEAFSMRYAALIVTAHDDHWLQVALSESTGYGCSVIGCDLEIAVDRYLDTSETPDGRVGARLLAFGFSGDAISQALVQRTGQCLMTCPTTAVFDGLPDAEKRVPLGKQLRYFGDGYQKSKLVAGRRYWRVPVMDGEFLVEDRIGVAKGVAGGNLIIQAMELEAVLASARRAVAAIHSCEHVIMPFPGGVARSGSKVGSRYKALKASTSDAYCPTLRGRVESRLQEGVNHALEIVIDGADEASVGRAMAAGLHAAVDESILAISAGNYGG